jgi:adenylosuccinate lyase
MIDRYNTQEMSNIWSDINKIKLWKEISARYAHHFSNQKFDINDLLNIDISNQEILEVEKKTKHEFLAFLEVLISKSPEHLKKYIHFGLTSSDVLDTTFSLQLKLSTKEIISSLIKFKELLKQKALDNKATIMMGRTHGMYAEPISFGQVLLSFYYEFDRSLQRLEKACDVISVGQLSGPVGNFTFCSKDVEKKVLEDLELRAEDVSSQVIPRDRYAELFCSLALLASSMERLATEIRQLSQSSVGEVAEGFAPYQKGSSAMPHKKNPISSENICGLSRLIRSYTLPAFENVVLWHERDMSHSSNERFIGQDATSLTYYALNRLFDIIDNLYVNKKMMMKNIENSKGLFYSQRLLNALIETKNYDRIKAYELVQKLTFECQNSEQSFVNILLNDYNINTIFNRDEILYCCNFDFFLNKISNSFFFYTLGE